MKFQSLIMTMLVAAALSACGGKQNASNSQAAPATPGATRASPEHAGQDRVSVSAEQMRSADIGLAVAGPASIREHLALYGVIAPNAERVMEVAARYPGLIRAINKRVGDPVKQGEVLATVESNESLQTYRVIAPLSGVVTARSTNLGEQTGDKSLFTVADLSNVWVELSLFPRDIAKVRLGQVVRVKSTDANLAGEGKIVYVAPFGSSTNQTLSARVLLENRDQRWPPGLYVSAEVTLGTTPVPLAIANQALQTVDNKSVVFVQNSTGFNARPVTLGRSDGESVEVLTGLSLGERYATRNSFILKAELGKSEAAHEE